MRLSQFWLTTQKETPADAEVISHQLMLRAGMIRQAALGIYSWLPLGLRVLRQVWVLKKELMMLPFFGWALAVLRPVPIDRKQKRRAMQQVIAEGRQRIESGYSVILFPEGTRAPADAPLPFKLGAARLAAALGVPAVPVAHNAGQFWPKCGLMHPGTVHVVVGDPIDPHGKTPAEINAIAETWINDTRARLVAAEKTRRGAA